MPNTGRVSNGFSSHLEASVAVHAEACTSVQPYAMVVVVDPHGLLACDSVCSADSTQSVFWHDRGSARRRSMRAAHSAAPGDEM